jgi:branched-chain amino acid transport system permease protein
VANFFRYVLIGLGDGAIYAMIGIGLVVIYRATGLLNFAQGELAMLCTLIVWTLQDQGLPLPVAIVGGMVAGFVIGALIQRIVIQPMGDPHREPLAVVIITIGLFLGVNALAQLMWGTAPRPMQNVFGTGQVRVFGVGIQWEVFGALAVLAVEAAVLAVIFRRTKIGLAMRAVASNPDSSALVGIPVNRMLLLGWGLAAALGAVAGSFAAPDRGLDSNLMLIILVYAFAAVTLGGFDSLVGAVVGGLVVGVVTVVIPQYVTALANLPLVPAFVLIFLVLLVRPQGLFGSAEVSRV